jgi:hypothetical protein
MPEVQYAHYNCNYTPISTAGTTTVDPGPASPGIGVGIGNFGVFYGVSALNAGTATGTFTSAIPTVAVYDIIPAQGNNAVTTNTLLGLQTATGAGQNFQANVGAPGPRYRGALVVVTAVTQGTAAGFNVFWD